MQRKLNIDNNKKKSDMENFHIELNDYQSEKECVQKLPLYSCQRI